MNLEIVMIVVGACGGLLCAMFAFCNLSRRYPSQLQERIARSHRAATESASLEALPAAAEGRLWTKLELLIPVGESLAVAQARLRSAGFHTRRALAAYFLARLCGLGLPVFIATCLLFAQRINWPAYLIYSLATATLAFRIPGFQLDRWATQRQATLRCGTPDFLDLMIVCLESGMSFPGTVQRVGEEIRIAHPLLADELDIVQREMSLGASIDQAFRNLAERTGLEVIRTLSTFIRESRRFGSELVDVFRTQADLLRHEREQQAEEQAQKASVKILFPMLVLILPAVFVVLAGPAALQIQAAFAR